ncbi:MAG TPA: hypothetical protein VFX59_23115 [Polyangiales bacterium]|nr:hypothetical protein [Polyangiales bacterium]
MKTKSQHEPGSVYADTMLRVRKHLEAMDQKLPAQTLEAAEDVAMHGRKVIEAIAYGSLLIAEHSGLSLSSSLRRGRGAKAILGGLEKRQLLALPSPSIFRDANALERAMHNVMRVIEGQPDRRLTRRQLEAMYGRFHALCHEPNPYARGRLSVTPKELEQVGADARSLRRFLERHAISINGQSFFCTLWDAGDGQLKVVPLSKVAA